MQHPFEVLKVEYASLLAGMHVTRPDDVERAARRVEAGLERYTAAAKATGVPAALIGALDYRESDCDPHAGLGQGDRWDRVSTHVPRGKGPFASWEAAAEFYLHFDHIDRPPAPWGWEVACYTGEDWNGFGYRAHGEHTPYNWGGTSAQQRGKFTADGHYDASAWDTQVGIIPIMRRLVALHPELALATALPTVQAPTLVPAPKATPVGVGAGGVAPVVWAQHALNVVAAADLREDGNYGRKTKRAVRAFQAAHGLEADGLLGPATLPLLQSAYVASTGAPVDAVEAGLAHVTAPSGVNLRAEPNRSAAVIRVLEEGTQVAVLSPWGRGDWAQVDTDTDGRPDGWVLGEFLKRGL